MGAINITINDLSTMNTSALNKLIKQMRRDEYLKIMTAFPVGRKNAMTAGQIAAATNTTTAMVQRLVRNNCFLNKYDIYASTIADCHQLSCNRQRKARRWMEIDENGTPTGVIKKEDREVTVYWVERKITLDDLL